MVMTLLLPPCIGLSCLPDLKVLAPSIAVATALMFITLGCVGWFAWDRWDYGLDMWREMSLNDEYLDYGDVDDGLFGGAGIIGETTGGGEGTAWSALSNVDWSRAPLAMCAVMYSLEGDQLILPIESAMKEPRKYFLPTFLISMTVVGLTMCAFAASCVIAFGRVDDGSITAWLLDHASDFSSPDDDGADTTGTATLALFVNVIAGLSLLFTYPLQLFPAVGLSGQIVARRRRRTTSTTTSIAERTMILGRDDDRDEYRHDVVKKPHPHQPYASPPSFSGLDGDSVPLRVALVLSTYVAAVLLPSLQSLIALTGAITGALTSLILPPALALKFETLVPTAAAVAAADAANTPPVTPDSYGSFVRGKERKASNGYDEYDGVNEEEEDDGRSRQLGDRIGLLSTGKARWFIFLISVGCVYGTLGTYFSVLDVVTAYL